MRVVVVGAGLAGLAAAARLSAAGHQVIVLEGRDEIGGRSRTRRLEGDVLELGAQFLAPGHHRMRRLVATAGLHLRRDHYTAGPVRWRRRDDPTGRLLPHVRPEDLVPLSRIVLGRRRLRALFVAATGALRSAELDSRTIGDWLDEVGLAGAVRHIFDGLVGDALGGVDPHTVSLLEFVELIGREGRGLGLVIHGLGLSAHVVEGTGAVCAYLASGLAAPIQMGMAVTAVDQDGDGVLVRTAGGESVEGDYTIMAIPTPVLSGVTFTPRLPEEIESANAAVRYGQRTKVAVVVKPRRALQAQAFLGGPVVRAGWRTRRVLYGFASADCNTQDAGLLADDLCLGFGVDPDAVEHVELVPWAQDPFTLGTYAHLRPGRFLAFRRSLPHHHHRVYFAGAERSSWPIYMEGAVESGEWAADAVIAAAR